MRSKVRWKRWAGSASGEDMKARVLLIELALPAKAMRYASYKHALRGDSAGVSCLALLRILARGANRRSCHENASRDGMGHE